MKRSRYLVIAALMLCVIAAFGMCFSVFSGTKDNTDLPITPARTSEIILHRTGYTSSYNTETKQPNWVAWHLTKEHVQGTIRRASNAWHEDTDVPKPRVNNYDYKGSGWSRDWNEIEMACRRWAEKYGDVYIVCGPVFLRQEHEIIGISQIPVPEAFFKVVMCQNGTPKGIGFICRNTDGNSKKDKYVNTIRQIERITGMTFFPNLPEDIVNQVKDNADINDWD